VKEFHVLNLGAGVQSTALFLLAREPDAKLRFDLAVFADTGEEPAAVYKHLDYLRTLGKPEIWVRSAGKLGDDLIHGRNSTGQRFVSIAGRHPPPLRPLERAVGGVHGPVVAGEHGGDDQPAAVDVVECDSGHHTSIGLSPSEARVQSSRTRAGP
jgi:hypothetical protein